MASFSFPSFPAEKTLRLIKYSRVRSDAYGDYFVYYMSSVRTHAHGLILDFPETPPPVPVSVPQTQARESNPQSGHSGPNTIHTEHAEYTLVECPDEMAPDSCMAVLPIEIVHDMPVVGGLRVSPDVVALFRQPRYRTLVKPAPASLVPMPGYVLRDCASATRWCRKTVCARGGIPRIVVFTSAAAIGVTPAAYSKVAYFEEKSAVLCGDNEEGDDSDNVLVRIVREMDQFQTLYVPGASQALLARYAQCRVLSVV